MFEFQFLLHTHVGPVNIFFEFGTHELVHIGNLDQVIQGGLVAVFNGCLNLRLQILQILMFRLAQRYHPVRSLPVHRTHLILKYPILFTHKLLALHAHLLGAVEVKDPVGHLIEGGVRVLS